jgi:polyferredoxin
VKRALIIAALLGVTLATAARAAERFALPEFKTGYVRPTPTTPSPGAAACEWLDVPVLAAMLIAASVLAIRVRSRRWLWVMMVGSLAYFGLWRGGCVCSVGSVQNVAMALGDSGYAIPLSVAAFFLLPLAFALFVGRTFCAGVCPLGALQELVVVRPIKVPAWLEHTLGLVAYVYLGAAVLFAATGAAFIICEYDPFISIFRLLPVTRPGAAVDAFGGSAAMLILGGCFLVAGMFIGRPYCRWLCPYGAVLKLLARAAKWRVTITPDECVRCRLCEDACPFGAIRRPTVEEPHGSLPIDRRRLATLLAVAPVILLAGAGLGWQVGRPFARMHFTVRLADRVHQEDAGQVQGTVDMTDAFYASGESREKLYADAGALERRIGRGTVLFGLWVGLVILIKLIHLSIRRRRDDYEADPAACVSCGRCFAYCPIERERIKMRGGTPPGP